jgi:hypothetical protein
LTAFYLKIDRQIERVKNIVEGLMKAIINLASRNYVIILFGVEFAISIGKLVYLSSFAFTGIIGLNYINKSYK